MNQRFLARLATILLACAVLSLIAAVAFAWYLISSQSAVQGALIEGYVQTTLLRVPVYISRSNEQIENGLFWSFGILGAVAIILINMAFKDEKAHPRSYQELQAEEKIRTSLERSRAAMYRSGGVAVILAVLTVGISLAIFGKQRTHEIAPILVCLVVLVTAARKRIVSIFRRMFP